MRKQFKFIEMYGDVLFSILVDILLLNSLRGKGKYITDVLRTLRCVPAQSYIQFFCRKNIDYKCRLFRYVETWYLIENGSVAFNLISSNQIYHSFKFQWYRNIECKTKYVFSCEIKQITHPKVCLPINRSFYGVSSNKEITKTHRWHNGCAFWRTKRLLFCEKKNSAD